MADDDRKTVDLQGCTGWNRFWVNTDGTLEHKERLSVDDLRRLHAELSRGYRPTFHLIMTPERQALWDAVLSGTVPDDS